MDATDLLAREDEFKRLNKQLKKKTESLMKEIEHVMQKPDFFSELSPSLTHHSPQHIKKHCCTPPTPQEPLTPIRNKIKKKTLSLDSGKNSPKSLTSDSEFEGTQIKNVKKKTQNRVVCDCCTHPNNRNEDMEFLFAFVSVNVKDKVLPPSFSKEDRVSVESVCKFLSSKVKLMQDQIDKLQNTIDRKASQCEAHLTQLAELESERMTLLNKSNNMKSTTADMRAKHMALQKRFDEKDNLYKEQRTESDKLSSEVKRLRSRNATAEAKCASQEQLIEGLKQQVELSKRAEQELRDSSRKLSSTYETAISRLEAQTAALNARTEKQMALIHNLRKQNALLATESAVDALDIDYSEFLNQDF